MGHQLVSIVLPTYNRARYLREAIQSCVDQTYPNWELIVVDDGSVDDTPSIAAQYEAADPRIRYLRHDTNRKLPAALNTGFTTAIGDLFTWTSDDNLFRPQALDVMVDFLNQNPDVDVVYSDYSFIDEEGNVLGYNRAKDFDELPYWNSVGAGFLYRRSLWDKLGAYEENSLLVEDYEYWLRASQSVRFHALHEDLYLYRTHIGSLGSSEKGRISIAVSHLLERCLSEMNWSRKWRSRAYLRLSREAGFQYGRVAAIRYLVKAIAESPACLFQRIALPVLAQIVMGPNAFGVLMVRLWNMRLRFQ